MALKIRIRAYEKDANSNIEDSELAKKTYEWKWLIPGISHWRLMNGDEVLASIKRKISGNAGARNYFYVASYDRVGIEIKLREPEYVNYHPSHKNNYPLETIATYSIKLWQSDEDSKKVEMKNDIGKLYHSFGPHLSPAKFHLKDYGTYVIEIMLENTKKRSFRVMSDENARLIAETSRTRTNREYRTFDPGTFTLLEYRDGDPNSVLMAIISFVFADIVHYKYDWGIL
jgi:hypothetical protein